MSAPTAPAATLPRTATATRTRVRRPRRDWGNFGLVAPFLIFYVLFLVGPLVYDVVLSLFNTSLVKGGLGSSRAWPTTGNCSVTASSGARCGTRSSSPWSARRRWSSCRCSSRSW